MIADTWSWLLFAAAPLAQSDTILTSGGGGFLQQALEAVSQILYGSGSSGLEKNFTVLVRLALAAGAFSCLCLAFARQQFDPLIRNFLLPSLVAAGLLLAPKTTVVILDRHASEENKKDAKQIEVPFFLGKLAALASHSFCYLQELFSDALGNQYPWTANIYAGTNFFRRGSVALNDPKLSANLREFCRECVFRDLGLDLYAKAEMVQQGSLLEFLEQKTSTLRGVSYQTEEGELETLPCREAIRRMRPLIEQAAEPLAALVSEPEIERLLHDKQDISSLIQQKIAIDLLAEETFGSSAALPDRTGSSLAAVSFISAQHFLEAMLYLAFPLVLLISLLSFGLRAAIHWVRLLLWACTWPVFYTAIDGFLSAVWDFRTSRVPPDLTLSSHAILFDLYASMETLACFLLALIPFLSWFFIKGGLAQIVHLTSSGTPKTTQKPPSSFSPPNAQNPSGHLASSEMLIREKESSEGGFQTLVEAARQEEWHDFLKQSLSSIREAVKDASEDLSKTIEQAARPSAPSPESPQLSKDAAEDGLFASRMHIPSYGSFASPPNPSPHPYE